MEVIVSKTHEDWLKNREGGIGSSEVGSLLGLNPYETPYQLWLRKTGRVPKVEQESFLMKAGHYLEDAVSRFYADETGAVIVKSSAKEFVVVDKERPFMRVSPDRYAYPAGAKKTAENRLIIECKTTQKSVTFDDLPKTWFVQLIYQLGVCKINQGALAWLISGREFGFRNFNFDAEFFGWIAEEVERFWTDCIVGDQEPALIDVKDILIKYPRHEAGKAVEATPELIERWQEYKDADAEVRRLTKIKDDAADAIKMAMADAESLVSPVDAHTIITWKASKDGTKFDAKRFEAENPDLYAKYTITTPGTRRFICKD